MDSRELRMLRKTRKLSQRDAARLWGVTGTTIFRWEHQLRPLPKWLGRMIEREKLLLKRIEAQEKEIAALQIHRNSLRIERLSVGAARPGAVRGGRRAARA
jgi:DNA-binding XRE family transcriptional regulator